MLLALLAWQAGILVTAPSGADVCVDGFAVDVENHLLDVLTQHTVGHTRIDDPKTLIVDDLAGGLLHDLLLLRRHQAIPDHLRQAHREVPARDPPRSPLELHADRAVHAAFHPSIHKGLCEYFCVRASHHDVGLDLRLIGVVYNSKTWVVSFHVFQVALGLRGAAH